MFFFIRKQWRWLARFFIGISLMSILLSSVDISELGVLVRNARIDLLVVMLITMVVARVYASYRWYILLKCHDYKTKFLPVLWITFASNFFGMFLPGGSIEVLRIAGLAKKSSDLAMSFSSVVVDRFFGLLTLALMALIGLTFSPARNDHSIKLAAMVCLAFLLLLFIALMNPVVRNFSDRIFVALLPQVIQEKFRKVYACLDAFRDSPVTMIWAFILAIGIQFLRVAEVLFGAWALNIFPSIIDLIIWVPVIVFIQLLPISVGGLGTREAAFVYFFGIMGVSYESAFSLSICIYFGTIISCLPGAWFSIGAFVKQKKATIEISN